MELLLCWILKMSRDRLSFRCSCRTLGITRNPFPKLTARKKCKIKSSPSLNEKAYLMKGMIIKKLFALFPRACLEVTQLP